MELGAGSWGRESRGGRLLGDRSTDTHTVRRKQPGSTMDRNGLVWSFRGYLPPCP